MASSSEHANKPLGSIKGEEFIEKLSDCWPRGATAGAASSVAYHSRRLTQLSHALSVRDCALRSMSSCSRNDAEGQYCSGPLKGGNTDAKLTFICHIIV
jgi:hypothetical protein